MPKNPSIEDLLPSSSGTKAVSSSSRQKSSSSTQPADDSVAEQMTEKMAEIRRREMEDLTAERAAATGRPYIALRGFAIVSEALSLIPRDLSRKLKLVAFFSHEKELRFGAVSMSAQVEALVKEIAEKHKAHAEIYLISEDSYAYAERLYDILPAVKEVIAGYRIKEEDLKKFEQEILNFEQLQKKITQVNITDVVTLMLGAALQAEASDIHIEAEEKDVKIRLRMDGVLQEAASLEKSVWQQVVSRLKLLAGVKINVEDVPQDGRVTIYLEGEEIDIRVSFLPTAFGESVVMRILRAKAVALEFESLGLRAPARKLLERQMERPHGVIITTGPTGSGKTTTLYAVLKKLNTPDVKIITLEDPIEYRLPGINQSQVDYGKQYDFAKGLRAILRQDPEVIMVGELRDAETVEIAIQAALTGHKVLSTLHTNSAAGAIPRFLSMGAVPYLLAPALNAIIGQRLVRRLCAKCKVPLDPTPEQMEKITRALKTLPPDSGEKADLNHLQFMGPGKGCDACHHLGYKGRVGIYEILIMSKEAQKIIASPDVSEFRVQEIAVKNGMVTMAQDGLLKALEGITSIEEVLSTALVEEEESPAG